MLEAAVVLAYHASFMLTRRVALTRCRKPALGRAIDLLTVLAIRADVRPVLWRSSAVPQPQLAQLVFEGFRLAVVWDPAICPAVPT